MRIFKRITAGIKPICDTSRNRHKSWIDLIRKDQEINEGCAINSYKYFVGHKAPDFPLWPGFSFFENENDVAQRGPYIENVNDDSVISEYFSLFNLKRKLREADAGPNDLITICQHRRFVLNVKSGAPAKNLPARVIAQDTIKHLSFGPELFPREGQNYLIGSTMKLKEGMMHQYARCHHIRDLLRFCSDLVDAELLTDDEAEEFLNQKSLMPAPSCGTFELHLFFEIMDFLETATEVFLSSGYKSYEDIYQFRVVAFLLERLNSWLLLKRMRQMSLDFKKIAGFTTIVSDSTVVQRGGTNRLAHSV